jgi:hypothetical protein
VNNFLGSAMTGIGYGWELMPGAGRVLSWPSKRRAGKGSFSRGRLNLRWFFRVKSGHFLWNVPAAKIIVTNGCVHIVVSRLIHPRSELLDSGFCTDHAIHATDDFPDVTGRKVIFANARNFAQRRSARIKYPSDHLLQVRNPL